MAAVEVTDANFSDLLEKHETVFLDFWAPWCGPCRQFTPIFEAVAEKFPNVLFGKVNSDEQQKLSGYFHIRSIPTLIILRQKIVIEQASGVIPEDALTDAVEKVLALDMTKVIAEVEAADQAEASEQGRSAEKVADHDKKGQS